MESVEKCSFGHPPLGESIEDNATVGDHLLHNFPLQVGVLAFAELLVPSIKIDFLELRAFLADFMEPIFEDFIDEFRERFVLVEEWTEKFLLQLDWVFHLQNDKSTSTLKVERKCSRSYNFDFVPTLIITI